MDLIVVKQKPPTQEDKGGMRQAAHAGCWVHPTTLNELRVPALGLVAIQHPFLFDGATTYHQCLPLESIPLGAIQLSQWAMGHIPTDLDRIHVEGIHVDQPRKDSSSIYYLEVHFFFFCRSLTQNLYPLQMSPICYVVGIYIVSKVAKLVVVPMALDTDTVDTLSGWIRPTNVTNTDLILQGKRSRQCISKLLEQGLRNQVVSFLSLSLSLSLSLIEWT